MIYQIYPRSFASHAGAIGTLAGVTARLGYLRDLGVDAIWLSPFYRSPQHDAGYDVANYCDVDPRFGTLADAQEMIEQAHAHGLKVIVDLVPNHTSEDHVWFQQALAAGPGSKERARYWFRTGRNSDDPAGGQPPNNWRSVFGGPAWTRVGDRADAPGSPWENDEEWYLHLFDRSQPDVNWEHPEVRAEFDRILRFWLDRGVDGFRVDVAHGLVKDPTLPNWDGQMQMADSSGGEYAPMFDQDGVHEIYRHWNEVLAEYPGDRMLVAEAWVAPADRLALYVRPNEMQQAFNFDFLCTPWQADALRRNIAQTLRTFQAVGAPATWVLSNHDVVRHASRLGLSVTGKGPNGISATDEQPDRTLGLRRARAATQMMLALPGSAYLYQGEELGLPEHTTLPAEVRQDPTFWRTDGAQAGRDGCRVPLPWQADAPGFGFSPSGQTWLPQPADWVEYAVDRQLLDPASPLALYRQLLQRRREWNLGEGDLEFIDAGPHAVAFISHGECPVLNLTAIGSDVTLPQGWTPVVWSSHACQTATVVPADTTVWAVRE